MDSIQLTVGHGFPAVKCEDRRIVVFDAGLTARAVCADRSAQSAGPITFHFAQESRHSDVIRNRTTLSD